jgi:hypothetical protein
MIQSKFTEHPRILPRTGAILVVCSNGFTDCRPAARNKLIWQICRPTQKRTNMLGAFRRGHRKVVIGGLRQNKLVLELGTNTTALSIPTASLRPGTWLKNSKTLSSVDIATEKWLDNGKKEASRGVQEVLSQKDASCHMMVDKGGEH